MLAGEGREDGHGWCELDSSTPLDEAVERHAYTGLYSSRVLLDGGRRSLSCLLAVAFPLLLVYY